MTPSRLPSSTVRTWCVVVVAGVVIAGCGSDDPAAEAVDLATTVAATTTTTTTVPPPPVTLDQAGSVTVPSVTVPDPISVAVVGDSLTLAATELIDVALRSIGSDVLAIDGVESRRMVGGDIPPGVDAIDEIVAGGARPDVWVIALGTNDVGAEVAGENATVDVREVLGALPVDARIVWVNTWIRDRAGDAALFNAVVRDELEARGGATIVDWYANGEDPGVIAADGIHLTDLGEARYAASIAAGVVELTRD